MKKLAIFAFIALALLSTTVFGQTTTFNQSTASGGVAAFSATSAANSAQSVILNLKSVHDTLAINGSCSAGTATLTVAAGVDGSVFTTLDSISTASTQIKQYTATTVGATVAVSPLSFQYVQITVGTCGSSNTSTLTVSAK